MEAAARRFFTSSKFAVIGASQDSKKFGYKILAWYHVHSLPVTPINPNQSTISVPSKSYETVPSASALEDPTHTALSFLTPPSITRKVLEEAQAVGVTSVWLQPGSFDDEGIRYAKDHFENAIGGFEQGTLGGEGWCVLVDGENCLRATGRKFQKQRL